MYDILELKKKKLQNLQEIAEKLEISEIKNLKKLDLIYQILDKQVQHLIKQRIKQSKKKEKLIKKVCQRKKPILTMRQKKKRLRKTMI